MNQVVKVMALLAVAIALTCRGGGIAISPVPSGKSLSGEKTKIWAYGGTIENSADIAYRWSIVCMVNVDVSGDGLGEWRVSEGKGDDIGQEVVCKLVQPSERGGVSLKLEILHPEDGKIEQAGERSWDVVQSENLSHREWTDIRKAHGVMDGLRWLVRQQHADGHWGQSLEPEQVRRAGDGWSKDLHNEIASTALALWALGAHGYGLTGESENPFRASVEAGLAYLARHVEFRNLELTALRQEMNSDENGNRMMAVFGGHSNVENYVQPLCIGGIVASGVQGAMFRTSRGEMTLRELVSEAGDFVVQQLSRREYFTSWSYYDSVDAPSSDLSVAGWNYLALEALSHWGRRMPMALWRGVKETLDARYDTVRNLFFYNEEGYMSTSVSIQASGLAGVQLLLEHCPEQSELQKISGAPLCMDAVTENMVVPERTGISLGEIQARIGTRIGSWLMSCDCQSLGYHLWNSAKALLFGGILHALHHDGAVDWRYGDGKQADGLWNRILDLQEENGQWMLASDVAERQFKAEQTELHQATMLLALAQDVFHPVEAPSVCVDVTCRLAPSIGEAAWAGQRLEKMEQDDGGWGFQGHAVLRHEDEQVELDYGFLAPEGIAGEWTDVQSCGEVSWTDEGGCFHVIELPPLRIERTGSTYGLNINCDAEMRRGELTEVTVNMVLPDSDHVAALGVSAGTSEEQWLFNSEGISTWLGVEEVSKGMTGEYCWLSRADSALKNFMTLSGGSWREGIRGRVFGVRMQEAGQEDQTILLKYNTEEIELVVTVTDTSGEIISLLERVLEPGEFGSAQTLTLPLDTGRLALGAIVCSAEMRRNGRELAESQAVATVFDMKPDEIEGMLECFPGHVVQGEAVSVISSVHSLSGKSAGVAAEVGVECEGMVSWTWFYDARQDDGGQTREFVLDTEDWEPGRYDMIQIVAPDNGQAPLVSEAVLIVEARTPAVRGAFEFDSYEMDINGRVSVGYSVENMEKEEHIVVEEVLEMGEGLLTLNGDRRNVQEHALHGTVDIMSVQETGERTAWLALVDTRADRLLDVTAVMLKSAEDKEPGNDPGDDDNPGNDPDDDEKPGDDDNPGNDPDDDDNPVDDEEPGDDPDDDEKPGDDPDDDEKPGDDPDDDEKPVDDDKPGGKSDKDKKNDETGKEPWHDSGKDSDDDNKNRDDQSNEHHVVYVNPSPVNLLPGIENGLQANGEREDETKSMQPAVVREYRDIVSEKRSVEGVPLYWRGGNAVENEVHGRFASHRLRRLHRHDISGRSGHKMPYWQKLQEKMVDYAAELLGKMTGEYAEVW